MAESAIEGPPSSGLEPSDQADILGKELYARMQGAIVDGLRRLDALPRSDPFWRDSNGRATHFKLRDYCNRMIASDPRDARALWTMIGLDILHGVNPLATGYWKRLRDLGAFKIEWLVRMAWWLEASTGEETASPLGREIGELGLCD